MTRHTIKAAFTRLVVIVLFAASVGVGSVGIGGTAEVAAMPVNCYRLNTMVTAYFNIARVYERLGDVSNEVYFYSLAAHWQGVEVAAGCFG
jgi:hypothetical protein